MQVNTAKGLHHHLYGSHRIEDAYLIVQIPAGAFKMPQLDDDTQFVALTLTDGNPEWRLFQELDDDPNRVLQPVSVR